MRLIYLTEANLADTFTIKDFIHNYTFPLSEKVILLHAPFKDSIRDTRFVSKRISTLLSENLVYNNAFQAHQRDLIAPAPGGKWTVNTSRITQLVAPIHMLIIGPVIHLQNGEEALASPLELFQALRAALPIDETILFVKHARSPLGQSRQHIETEAQRDQLCSVYEEERHAIELAYSLRPATLTSPSNFVA